MSSNAQMYARPQDHEYAWKHDSSKEKKIKVSLWIPKITQSNILHKEDLK